MFLLDANVVSEFRKARPHGAVEAWVRSVPATALFLSVVSLYEIQAGIELTRAPNPQKSTEIETWLERIAKGSNILPLGAEEMRLAARLMFGKPGPHAMDAMIAATALTHGLTVATGNVRDFANFGIDLLNPFETPHV